MGRTSPTLRDRFDALERDWQPFRRSLRRRHQPDFDRLFERARGHADAASQQNPADHWDAFVLAVLCSQEAELRALREAIEQAEEKDGEERGDDGRDDPDDGRDEPNDDGQARGRGTVDDGTR